MKKKGTQYILIAVVLGIWGMIGMRMFNFFSDEEESSSIKNSISNINELNMANKAYTIEGNYADPFLKDGNFNETRLKYAGGAHSYASDKKAYPKKEIIKTKEAKKPEQSADPLAGLKLTGIISNRQSGKKSAIVSHEGKEYSILQGETVNGIKLSKIFSDSVMVTFQKKNKIIKL